MANRLLKLAYEALKTKGYDAYYFSLSNEHLYEFTNPIDNFVVELTGFTGDTGSVLITKKRTYLYVDGRFTIQARREVNDKTIDIIEYDSSNSKIDDILNKLKSGKALALNPKIESTGFVLKLKERLTINKVKLVLDYKFLSKEFKLSKKHTFYLSSAPLFLLEQKYVGENYKSKVNKLFNVLKSFDRKVKKIAYITSNLEEIAYLTSLRYELCDLDSHGLLFNSFFIITNNQAILYIDDYIEDESYSKFIKNNIIVKNLKDFYFDIKNIKLHHKVYMDKSINNYYIYKLINPKNDQLISSPLCEMMSIKNKVQIKNLHKCNIIDGLAMTKILYYIKSNLKNINKYNEYDIKMIVDSTRANVGKSYYLCPSFETIVAYKENSAICHYIPTKKLHKKLSNNSLLLIDSGGDYLYGTTDITRTISLYSDKNAIPKIIKKHYTLVLKAMLNLAILKFPYGLTGFEIDIIARKDLYNDFLDFNHGTGHGIGYISNVHEGPNRIGPIVNNNYAKNVMMPYQVTSDEPGLYFENKYGIRIENDLLTKPLKTNEYGDFLGFETLTLCPFDRDLIDKKYLDIETIKFLNEYNKLIYRKLYRYLDKKEREWLKKETKEV